ncbi:aminoglycoside phosphotransferase family protein [Frankia sp. Cas3]|uniref:aminoglycoside phosphotransferase family protein n=1 Tax=Frankia sp. Cas3 TaxID=3073926 RepID=UPI002AD35D4F|nr:aminoglycoside phosphotransferase family protein [Frankia sp. Cas3]
MTSSSGPETRPETVRSVAGALAAVGLAAGRVTPLFGGYGGETFRVTTQVGELVVKVRSDVRPLAVTRTASHLLSGRGLPHQDVVVPPTWTPAGWLIAVRWIDGHDLSHEPISGWSTEQATRLGGDLGAWLSRMHSIRAPGRDWLGMADRRFTAKLRHGAARGHLATGLVVQLEDFWQRVRPALDGAPVALVHRDLWAGNVVVRDGLFAAVIDLEKARLADPLYDMVKITELVLRLHPVLGAAFREAYGLDTECPDVRDRLAAVFALEYLSAVVYFDTRGDQVMVADQCDRLARLLRRPFDAMTAGQTVHGTREPPPQRLR